MILNLAKTKAKFKTLKEKTKNSVKAKLFLKNKIEFLILENNPCL